MHSCLGRALAAFALALPLAASAVDDDWVTISRDGSREIQVDRASVIPSDAGTRIAWARMVMSPEEAERAGYTAVLALNRFDCLNRGFLTVRRRYIDERNVVLREEEVIDQAMRPVASGGVDDRLWREICRPPSSSDLVSLAGEADRIAAALETLPSAKPVTVATAAPVPVAAAAPAVTGPASSAPAPLASTAPAVAALPPPPPQPAAPPAPSSAPRVAPRYPLPDWDYGDLHGPQQWGVMRPEWAACREGKRQSPIELQSGLVVQLEPVEFDYLPTLFRVIDTGRLLRIQTGAGLGARIRGERYELIYVEVHRPGQERVDGVVHDLSVDLHHRSADGRMAVVSIQFRAGTAPNSVLTTLLSALPLERGAQYGPDFSIDLRPLLPSDPAHFMYSGSLTSPPCTEGVLRVVMKQPMEVSWEQLGVISRLHPPSARPLQDGFDRRVLESR